MSEKYIAVKIKSDGDGHDFIVPNELETEFDVSMEKCYDEDDYEECMKFSEYSIGGSINNYQFYITELELNKLRKIK